MGLPWSERFAFTTAAAFPGDGDVSGPHAHPDLRGIGGCVVLAVCAAPDTVGGEGLRSQAS